MTFVRRVLWTRVSDTANPIVLKECINVTANKTVEVKNNILQITLKNSPNIIAEDGSTIVGQFVDPSTQLIKFEEEDQVSIWSTFLDDASLVDSTWWNDTNLIGNFVIEESRGMTESDQNRIILKCIDAAFLLFNKVYTFSYGVGNKFTAPGIIRHISRLFTETDSYVTKYSGTHNDTGTTYAVNAAFVSEGGLITDRRTTPTTTLSGSHTDSVTTITVASTTGYESEGTLVLGTEHLSYTGTTSTTFTGVTRAIDDTKASAHNSTITVYQGFPLVLFNKIWKPLFEWIGEISQTDQVNYLSEIQEGGTAFFGRAFVLTIDSVNNVKWFYPDDTVDLTVDLSEEGRRSFQLEKAVFDAINFVIYDCGEDMNGQGTLHYVYDETSEVKSLKMRFQPMTKIIHTLVDEDRKLNTSRDTSERDIYKQYPNAYPMTPSFIADSNRFRATLGQTARTTVADDSNYNDSLREAAKWRGRTEAFKITKKRSGLRYRGKVVVKGTNVRPGDLIRTTNPWQGVKSQLLRVLGVNHQQNTKRWESVLDVQEDEKSIV